MVSCLPPLATFPSLVLMKDPGRNDIAEEMHSIPVFPVFTFMPFHSAFPVICLKTFFQIINRRIEQKHSENAALGASPGHRPVRGPSLSNPDRHGSVRQEGGDQSDDVGGGALQGQSAEAVLVGHPVESLGEVNRCDNCRRPTVLKVLSDGLEGVYQHVGSAAAPHAPILVGLQLDTEGSPVQNVRLVHL